MNCVEDGVSMVYEDSFPVGEASNQNRHQLENCWKRQSDDQLKTVFQWS